MYLGSGGNCEPVRLPKFNISTPHEVLHSAKGLLCALHTKRACLPLMNVKSQPKVTKPLRKISSMEEETKMNQNHNNNNKRIKEKKTI